MGHFRPLRNALIALAVLMFTAPALAQSLLQSPPPAPYVNVSTLLPLPEFIPGAGALFIDPANAATGPWLSYGNDGKLVEILFMLPVKGFFDGSQSMDDMGAAVIAELATEGVTIDHVDLTYNGGHPGLAEPHYHVRLSLMPHDQQVADLTGK